MGETALRDIYDWAPWRAKGKGPYFRLAGKFSFLDANRSWITIDDIVGPYDLRFFADCLYAPENTVVFVVEGEIAEPDTEGGILKNPRRLIEERAIAILWNVNRKRRQGFVDFIVRPETDPVGRHARYWREFMEILGAGFSELSLADLKAVVPLVRFRL